MHTLLHIYGPFAIHSYGLAIAIGVLIFTYLVKRDSRFKNLDLENNFISIMLVGTIAAIIGGRLLFFFYQPEFFESPLNIISFWEPGFSILGSIIAVLFTVPLYLKYLQIPIVPFFDLIAIYAPLLQSISRIGCFFAGCCYGIPTTKPWGIVYTDTGSAAPLYMCVHPTQIYSAIFLLLIFAGMYFGFQHIFKKSGQLTCLYLILTSTERFIADFWRGDRNITPDSFYALSGYQLIAAGIALGATSILTWLSLRKSS